MTSHASQKTTALAKRELKDLRTIVQQKNVELKRLRATATNASPTGNSANRRAALKARAKARAASNDRAGGGDLSDNARRAHEYFSVLMNPFKAAIPSDLQPPSLHPDQPTLAFRMEHERVLISTDEGSDPGEFMVLFKPGLAAAFASSGAKVEFSVEHLYASNFNVNPTVSATYPVNGTQTMDQYAAGDPFYLHMWDSFPEANSVIADFSAYQVLAAGLSVSCDTPAITASGRLIAGSIPGYTNIPQLDPVIPDVMSGASTQILTPESLRTLPDAQSFSVMEGAHISWLPDGPGAFCLRPTKYVPPGSGLITSACIGLDASPCCDGDTASFVSIANDEMSRAQQVALSYNADGTPLSPSAQANVTLYEQRRLAGILPGESPTLAICGDGLAPGTVFRVQYVQVLAAVAEAQTLGYSQSPSLRVPIASNESVATHTVMQAVKSAGIHVASPQVQHASVRSGLSRHMAKAASTIKDILDTGGKIAKTIYDNRGLLQSGATKGSSFMRELGLGDFADVLEGLGSAGSAEEAIGALGMLAL